MVDMIQSPFMWGTDGKPRSPAQVKQQRDVAAALLASAPQGKGWASALGEGLKGLAAGINNNQAGIYEQQGLERAGELFAGIGPESESSVIAAALADPAAIWATPAQSGVAEALLGEQMRRNSPDYALDLAYKQAQIAAMEREAQMGPGGNETFFGNAVPMQDENGNIVLGQMSNQGRWQPLQGAEGYSPAPTTKQIDTGTEIITTDIYGNELYRTPKDIRGAEVEQAIGAAEGAAIAAAPADVAAGEMALDLLNQIETNPELPWATGQSVQFGGNTGLIPGTQGRMDFQNLVDQATSGAFLTAISDMRGLGSLSNAEGQTATAAVTRMNTATSEAAFRKALADYREVIQRGLDKARSRLPGSSNQGQQGPSVGMVEDGYRFIGGNPSDPNAWEKVN